MELTEKYLTDNNSVSKEELRGASEAVWAESKTSTAGYAANAAADAASAAGYAANAAAVAARAAYEAGYAAVAAANSAFAAKLKEYYEYLLDLILEYYKLDKEVINTLYL